MQEIQNKKAFICDMDGVIYHGSKILDGVKEFVRMDRVRTLNGVSTF